MLTSSTTTPNPTPFVPIFLNLIDRLFEPLGLNVPQIIEIEKMRSLPEGTFGRTCANFLDQHHLQPFTTGPRRKQLHDAVHVLTGYDTDPVAEIEVQAFLLGAKFRIAHVIIGLGLLGILVKQQILNAENSLNLSWETWYRAYQRGQKSRFDVDTWKPELLWELPLTEVQSLFNV
jgi:ubiquinone biosynthesis protein COQ4